MITKGEINRSAIIIYTLKRGCENSDLQAKRRAHAENR